MDEFEEDIVLVIKQAKRMGIPALTKSEIAVALAMLGYEWEGKWPPKND